MASGTGSPSPSNTVPKMRMTPGVSAGTTSDMGGRSRPNSKKGPTVCEGVGGSCGMMLLALKRGGLTSPHDDVEAIAQRPLGCGERPVKGADHPIPIPGISDGVHDGVEGEKGIA